MTPKDGLRMFAGPFGVCVTVAVYEAAVVGEAAEDQGVSPRKVVAKNAPFASTWLAVPAYCCGVAPVVKHADVGQKVAPVGVAIASGLPGPAHVKGDVGQKPKPKNPIWFWLGAELVVDAAMPPGKYVALSTTATPVLDAVPCTDEIKTPPQTPVPRAMLPAA